MALIILFFGWSLEKNKQALFKMLSVHLKADFFIFYPKRQSAAAQRGLVFMGYKLGVGYSLFGFNITFVDVILNTKISFGEKHFYGFQRVFFVLLDMNSQDVKWKLIIKEKG